MSNFQRLCKYFKFQFEDDVATKRASNYDDYSEDYYNDFHDFDFDNRESYDDSSDEFYDDHHEWDEDEKRASSRSIADDMCYYLKTPPTALYNIKASKKLHIYT